MDKIDVAIIGAGVEGLAIAAAVTEFAPETYIFERNNTFGQETSSRNSEVLHYARVYYQPGSLKARLCSAGINQVYSFPQRLVPHKKVGKLIVATDHLGIPKLESLLKVGLENGASSLRMIDEKEISILEPNINAVAAIYSPDTGIIDSHRLMEYFLRLTKHNLGVNPVAYCTEVIGIEKVKSEPGFRVVFKQREEEQSVIAKVVVNAAGLGSERIAQIAGIDTKVAGYEMEFWKGEYFSVSAKHTGKTRHLIYPIPEGVGLGIHSTLDMSGHMRLGPNAFRVDSINYSVDESKKQEFYEAARKALPFLNSEDLQPYMSGIRPRTKIGDFIIREESERGLPGMINLIGIDSPGLTASLAIGNMVGEMVRDCLK